MKNRRKWGGSDGREDEREVRSGVE